MKRIDIYIAVSVFLMLAAVHEYNVMHGISDELIKTFATGAFSALLVLFQQRARLDAHVDEGNINVNPKE